MKNKNIFTYTAFAAFTLSLAFAAGYFTRGLVQDRQAELPLLRQAHSILLQHALADPPPPPALEYGMIRGMVQAFGDPYTVFVEPARHELESNDLQGSFGGIGVRLVRDESGNVLLYPFPDSPAQEAGILDADQLVAVDELNVSTSTPIDLVTAAIRGPEGSRTTLKVLRSSESEARSFTVRRASVPLPSVTWRLAAEDQRVGVVEINILAASTVDEVARAFNQLIQQGAGSFVLDLRDNNGGLLTAGVDTARLFLTEGEILRQRYRDAEVETRSVQRPGPFTEFPLVVLINQNTASAAEILAGALQLHQRAILVGHPSFGKDSIQLVFDLEDGSSLHVTAARWMIPGLEPPIADGGVQPDLVVAQEENPDSGPDPALQAAIELLYR